MSDRIFYEVIDATDDEMYYPLGLFLSLESAENALSEYGHERVGDYSETCETIKVVERKEGISDYRHIAREYSRTECKSDPGDDDSDWVLTDMAEAVRVTREQAKQERGF